METRTLDIRAFDADDVGEPKGLPEETVKRIMGDKLAAPMNVDDVVMR